MDSAAATPAKSAPPAGPADPRLTAGEMIGLLSGLDPNTTMTVWDPLLDVECHVSDILTATGPGRAMIESTAQRVVQ